MQSNHNDDLNWLAFCYVHGELSPDDAVAFEARLGADSAACEAVAHVVHLGDVLSAADCPVALQPHAARSVTFKRAVALLALAAGLIIAVSIWQLAQSEQRASRLALAWSDLVASLTASDENNQPTTLENDDESTDSGSDSADQSSRPSEESPSADDVPGWLLAAVEYESQARSMPPAEQVPDVLIPEPTLEN